MIALSSAFKYFCFAFPCSITSIVASGFHTSSQTPVLPLSQRAGYRFPARLGIDEIPEIHNSGDPLSYGGEGTAKSLASDELDSYLQDSSNSSEDERFADGLIYDYWTEGGAHQATTDGTIHNESLLESQAPHEGKAIIESSTNDANLMRWPDLALDMHDRIKIVVRLARIYQLSERYVPNILRARYQHEDGVKILSDDMQCVIEAARELKMRGWTARRHKKQKQVEKTPSASKPLTVASLSNDTELSREDIKKILQIVSSHWHHSMSSHTRRDARRRILAAIQDPDTAKRILEGTDHSFIEAFARQVGPARYKQYQWQLKLPISQVEEVYRIVLAQMIEDGIHGSARGMGIRRLGLTLNHKRAQHILNGDKDLIAAIIGEITRSTPTTRGVKGRPAALDD